MQDKTIKDLVNTTPGKVVIVIAFLLMVTSLLPSLLNSRSDFAVYLGIALLVLILVGAYYLFTPIATWLGFIVRK